MTEEETRELYKDFRERIYQLRMYDYMYDCSYEVDPLEDPPENW